MREELIVWIQALIGTVFIFFTSLAAWIYFGPVIGSIIGIIVTLLSMIVAHKIN